MRYTDEDKQEIIEDWHQSGLSKAAYCREHDIDVTKFYYWTRSEGVAPPGFVQLIVDQSLSVRVTMPSGRALELSADSSDDLASLLFAMDRHHVES